MLSAAFSPADARRGGNGFRGSFGSKSHGRSFSGPRFHIGPRFGSPGHYRPYRRHRHIYVLPPTFYGIYDYSSCGWLRRRALRTGSPYWWESYHACIDGY
jgi:hypothetical protein